jgi:hypothetical protein
VQQFETLLEVDTVGSGFSKLGAVRYGDSWVSIGVTKTAEADTGVMARLERVAAELGRLNYPELPVMATSTRWSRWMSFSMRAVVNSSVSYSTRRLIS